MDWTKVLTTTIITIFGAGGIVVVYVNHILNKHDSSIEELREVNEEISAAKTLWYDYVFEVIRCLVHKAKGRDINGDLDKAFDEYEEKHRALKNLYIRKSRLRK